MFLESFFILFGLGMILSMISVLLSKNSVISVVSLIGFFLNGAGLLFFFRAEYLGIVYVVVYIGAIAVLFLFVVMMLDFKAGSSVYNHKTEYFISGSFLLVLFLVYAYNFFVRIFYVSYNYSYFKTGYVYKNFVDYVEPLTDMMSLGSILYTYYFLFFLMCGFLLFVAMIGAIVLTLFRREGVRAQSLSDQILRRISRSVYFKNNIY